ncbi:uncharacterized protein [Triticum aestivum]|uniref:uncharacterized protein n=1 Tax=Triticum aestivum TaxID=4565 RepID=UPI001D02CB06|nr:uncharacterized protein LOC123067212 [Triticum aestivum]
MVRSRAHASQRIRSTSLGSSSSVGSSLPVGAVDGRFLAQGSSADEARLRRQARQDIRRGKRPVDSSSVGRNVRPVLEELVDPCLLAVRAASGVEVLCRPYFTVGWLSGSSRGPTPSVLPTPVVSRVDAVWNRRKRRILRDYYTSKKRVPAMEPPFAKENILLLKGVSRVRSYYGGPEYVCPACHASFWFLEGCKSYATGGGRLPVYTGCCKGGKVSLPSFPGGPYVFKMNGVVYHRIGPLLPSGNSAPKYAQLYMVESADEVQLRISAFDRQGAETLDPDPGIVASLIAMLNRHHKLVHKFRMARENLCSPSAPRVAIHFMGDEGGGHGDRFSGPASCEVVALIVGDYTPECKRFDVIAETRSGFLRILLLVGLMEMGIVILVDVYVVVLLEGKYL